MILRLSSIGDVILTSPIIRSLATCLPESELHFLTKAAYAPLLDHHPQLEKVHRFEGNLQKTIQELETEDFDFVLDLHQNIRTARIKLALGIPSATYSKDRWAVLAHTKFKLPTLPNRHTVERYAQTLDKLDCQLDEGGLELHLPSEAHKAAQDIVQRFFHRAPLGIVLGAGFLTKRWPAAHFIDLINAYGNPVLLLGGPGERAFSNEIADSLQVPHLNATGHYNLVLSAALVRECQALITHDTGLMHVAAAFQIPAIVLWGNTAPEIGFAPYNAPHQNLQVEGLSCRPCTKLGHDQCPKSHFRCMNDLLPAQVLEALQTLDSNK